MIKIALTGGPCSGKTTLIKELTPFLESLGYNVYRIPEAATIFINAGMMPKEWTPEAVVFFQSTILRHQIAIENAIGEAAKKSTPSIVLCDRGTLDGKAYARPDLWERVLKECYVEESELLEQYDAVIHLQTAAIGAEQFYSFGQNSDTNAARYENLEEAIQSEDRTLRAWEAHPSRITINNNGNTFSHKLDTAKHSALGIIKFSEYLRSTSALGESYD